MDPDLVLVIGVILGVFTVPSILSAISDGRAPRASALTILISGSMILWAVTKNPAAYTIEGLPDLFVQVVARYLT